MKDDGKLASGRAATAGEALGPEFWKGARLEAPRAPKSVHLKVDSDVFDFFKAQGKGHLTRMQDVLRAYVRAQQR